MDVKNSRFSLSALPSEIKRRIAHQVDISDKTFWHRSSQSGFGAVKAYSQDVGFALKALSEVSKEWRALCLPFMLEVGAAQSSRRAGLIPI